MLSKKSALLAAMAAGTLALSACGGGSDDAGSTEEGGLDLVSEGSLTVCSDIPFPPFEFEENGEYKGFDMDLMREIATGMDLEFEVQDVGFESLQSGAVLGSSGQCDIGASSVSITEERQANLTFSDPYYDSLQSVLVPTDSEIASIDDLAGKKVGVQQGTTGANYAEEKAPEAEIVQYPSDAEMYAAVQAGNVDALLQDLPVNLNHTKDGAFTIAAELPTDEKYGFIMPKEGSEELVSAVNEQLSTLRDNGRYQEIYDSYFAE